MLAFALAGAGCRAERLLVITSDPPGADVRLDGELVGKTPQEIAFDHYGSRRVTLLLEGYLSHSEVVKLEPPWFATFPIDYISELLIPVGWRDVHRVHASLEPGSTGIQTPDLKSVLERAESLRSAGPEGPRPIPKPTEGEPEGEPETPPPGNER